MHHDTPFQQTIDPVLGRRLLNISWLSAGLGISTFQMLVLAQAWQATGKALVPACMVSAWTLGSQFGVRFHSNARLWGNSLLLSALLWLGGTRLVTWHLPLLPLALVHLCALAIGAFVLGSTSSAWHTPRPRWPSVGKRITLCRSLSSTMAGLVIVWVLPTWSFLIGIACLLPLLVLDALPDACCPLPQAGSVLDAWISRYWNPIRWQPQVQEGGMRKNWTLLSQHVLDARQYLPLTLLSSGTTVILGAVWGAVPTPFAAGLMATHTLGKLDWLLMSQVIALAGTFAFLTAATSGLSFPNRLLPASWRPRGVSFAVLMLFLMGASLITLGLPVLQAPGWPELSLGCYTAAAALWGVLFPRLRPSPSTVVFAYRHRLAGYAKMYYPKLTYESAPEGRFTRMLTTVESFCIAVLTPALGLLIDRLGSVDTVLILVGLLFVLLLSLVLIISSLLSGLEHARSRTSLLAW